MLILSRKIDEKIKIGNDITITLIDVHGDQVKIGVEAPKNVKVFRQEVYDAIQSENKAAAIPENDIPNNQVISAVSALSKLLNKKN
ncbi:MAG: carbon storage regulator CsrA [Treponema sp.]|nr:carbon storage regulator CsrA [Treponema sp.]